MPYGITQCYLPPGRGDIPDVHETFSAETETLGTVSETRPRQDVTSCRDVAETFGEKQQAVPEVAAYRDNIEVVSGLITSHL